MGPTASRAEEPLVILASPTLERPLVALAEAFEGSHPDVQIKILLDSAMALRGTIGRLQHSGRYGPHAGLVHLVVPADQELLDRLEYRYYVLPGTRRAYATDRLVLVVPNGSNESALSLADLVKDKTRRLVVADPEVSGLGHQSRQPLDALLRRVEIRSTVIVAHDAHGIVDRLAHGMADVGILFEHQAAQARTLVRLAGVIEPEVSPPVVYAMAMDRFCPNRTLCHQFLEFSQSHEARAVLARLGYGPPPHEDRAGRDMGGAPKELGASRSGRGVLGWLGSWFGRE